MKIKSIRRTAMLSVRLKGATRYSEQAKAYVAYCPVLNVYSQGLTENHAETALAESIRMYINGCYRLGTLFELLERAGFQPADGPVSVTPEEASQEYIEIREAHFEKVFDMDIPLPFIAAASLERADARLSPACA